MFTTILGLLLFLLVVIGIVKLVRNVIAYRDHRRQAALTRRPPKLSAEQREAVRRAHIATRDSYLDDMRISWYQVVLVFVVGSVAGLLLEEVWMFVTAHLTQSRVGLVWGPFSPLYGFGATLLTVLTFELRKHDVRLGVVFLVAVLVGGGLEQITGWGMQSLFHVESWTYEHLPDHITKYIAWRFLLFWGLLGLIWYKFVMPNLLYLVGQPTTRRATVFVSLLAVYLGLDIFMTLAVFTRMEERSKGIAPQDGFERYLDENYNDTWIRDRFQNMVVETAMRETEAA